MSPAIRSFRIRFDQATCRACPTRQVCTAAKEPRGNSPCGPKPTMRRCRPPANARRRPIQRAVCAPVGCREQPLARHSALCSAPESLSRHGAHAPSATAHCHGDEYRAGDRLAQGRTFRRAQAEAGILCAVGAASLVTPDRAVLGGGLNQQSQSWRGLWLFFFFVVVLTKSPWLTTS